jgi:hypothetical protein
MAWEKWHSFRPWRDLVFLMTRQPSTKVLGYYREHQVRWLRDGSLHEVETDASLARMVMPHKISTLPVNENSPAL